MQGQYGSLSKFNSPLSKLVRKHKDYRTKNQHVHSVEFIDDKRGSSIDKTDGNYTIIESFSNSLPIDKQLKKRRAKYLTNTAVQEKSKSNNQGNLEIKLVHVDLDNVQPNSDLIKPKNTPNILI